MGAEGPRSDGQRAEKGGRPVQPGSEEASRSPARDTKLGTGAAAPPHAHTPLPRRADGRDREPGRKEGGLEEKGSREGGLPIKEGFLKEQSLSPCCRPGSAHSGPCRPAGLCRPHADTAPPKATWPSGTRAQTGSPPRGHRQPPPPGAWHRASARQGRAAGLPQTARQPGGLSGHARPDPARRSTTPARDGVGEVDGG